MSAPSASLAVALPGVRIEHRVRDGALADELRTFVSLTRWRIAGAIAARRIRLAMASGDPAALDRLAPRLRARMAGALTVPVSLMNQLTDNVLERRLSRALVRFTFMGGPDLREDAAVLYLPGGSFVIERSPQVTALVCQIARAAHLPVLVCDYRIAPEHPCPAAVDDAAAAIRFLMAQGIAPEAIAIAAESGGAAVGLAAAQRLAREGVRLGALAFLSPWVDLTLPHAGIADLTRVCAMLYRGERAADDPVVSPLFGDFAGLPPIAIHASRRDPLFGDAVNLSRAAAKAGLDVTLRVWPGGMHVFERYFDRNGARSIDDLSAFLRARLTPLARAA